MSFDDDVHATTAPTETGRLTIRRHASVVAAAHDPTTFSNAVSRHLQVPNGLDGERHAAARRVLDPFFADDRIDALEPIFTTIARDLLGDLGTAPFDAVADFGARFAVRGQSAWLGWDPALEDELLGWVQDNRAASRSGERHRTAAVAAHFDRIITGILDEHRANPRDDVTAELMALRLEDGSALRDEQIVSVLRNWTGGDLSSIALCTGVLVHWFATHPEIQGWFAAASDRDRDHAIDEILRIDDPFVSNRRIATRDTVVDGCPVAAGDVVVLHWRDANRDPEVFGDPDAFDPAGNAPHNVVYGTGPHVCPGRTLATRELRVLMRVLVAAGTVVIDGEPVREESPVAGFRTVPVRVLPAA